MPARIPEVVTPETWGESSGILDLAQFFPYYGTQLHRSQCIRFAGPAWIDPEERQERHLRVRGILGDWGPVRTKVAYSKCLVSALAELVPLGNRSLSPQSLRRTALFAAAVRCIPHRKVDSFIDKKILNFVFAFLLIYAIVYLFRLRR